MIQHPLSTSLRVQVSVLEGKTDCSQAWDPRVFDYLPINCCHPTIPLSVTGLRSSHST